MAAKVVEASEDHFPIVGEVNILNSVVIKITHATPVRWDWTQNESGVSLAAAGKSGDWRVPLSLSKASVNNAA